MVQGCTSFTHNPDVSSTFGHIDEAMRPQVMVARAWGGQTASGEWDYVEDIDTSRARGGTAHGGVLLTPAHLELEDYFAIGSATNVRTMASAPPAGSSAVVTTGWDQSSPWVTLKAPESFVYA